MAKRPNLDPAVLAMLAGQQAVADALTAAQRSLGRRSSLPWQDSFWGFTPAHEPSLTTLRLRQRKSEQRARELQQLEQAAWETNGRT